MDWNTISTVTKTSEPIDLKKMLALMGEIKAKSRFLDAMRDVTFEDMRARGLYIKSERDALGEFWVVDDAVLKQLVRTIRNPAAVADPFYGIRVVPLSQWRLKETSP